MVPWLKLTPVIDFFYQLRPLLSDRATRIILFEASDPKIYPPDGSFSPERAEALLEGRVTGLHQVPDEGEGDYGWIQTCNSAGWFLRYLGLAYYHDRDPKWVREFQKRKRPSPDTWGQISSVGVLMRLPRFCGGVHVPSEVMNDM